MVQLYKLGVLPLIKVLKIIREIGTSQIRIVNKISIQSACRKTKSLDPIAGHDQIHKSRIE